jgi:hypothetical protein
MRLVLAALLAASSLGCSAYPGLPRQAIVVRDLSAALPQMSDAQVRVRLTGGACCPTNTLPGDFKQRFSLTALEAVREVLPQANLRESDVPPIGEWLVEIDFRMADQIVETKRQWPGLIEVKVTRTSAATPSPDQPTEVAHWTRKLVYGDTDHIIVMLRKEIARLQAPSSLTPAS